MMFALACSGATFKGDVNIQANKEVKFKIIKRIMFSCATAGYTNINFAVLQRANSTTGEKSASLER